MNSAILALAGNKMRSATLGASVLFMLSITSGLMAQSFNLNSSILSAFKDVSNFSYSATRFGFSLLNDGAETIFINSIDFLPGVGYDAAIGLASPFDLDSSQPLGTAIAPDAGFFVFNAVERFDAVDPLAANGIYDFSLEVFGGDSDISFNSLAFLD